MRVRVLKPIMRWLGYVNLQPGQELELSDAQAMHAQAMANSGWIEIINGPSLPAHSCSCRRENGEGGEAETKQAPPSGTPSPPPRELVAWLESKGFSRAPDAPIYHKIDRLGDGRVVKLTVDFTKSPRGSRYGYELNEATGGWKNVESLRDHPLLLEYKQYRDKLMDEEAKSQAQKAMEVPQGEEGQQLLLRMEERDEAQILDELKGDFQSEVLRQYFYEFEHKGRKVVGLSYKGVKQIALKQGNITLKDLELRETPEGWIAIVKARHETRNLEVYGAAWQSKIIGFDKLPDPFALQKAVAKAQRNALRALIPETIIVEAYRAWQERREEWFGEK